MILRQVSKRLPVNRMVCVWYVYGMCMVCVWSVYVDRRWLFFTEFKSELKRGFTMLLAYDCGRKKNFDCRSLNRNLVLVHAIFPTFYFTLVLSPQMRFDPSFVQL